MKGTSQQQPSVFAILTLAEVKAATDAFDRGENNVFDTLDTIVVAVEAYRSRSCGDDRRGAA